jgi:alpha-galactosidase
MGWNSWNKFQCDVSDALIRQITDAVVSSGMRDAGYAYIIIDDCWMTMKRERGHLQPDPATFPYGIKPLADYVHSRGLKFGLYSDRGTQTCQGRAASHGHEKTDARDFADWGVDYLKYDNCNPAFLSVQEWDYKRMKKALDSTGRPIIFSICTWGHFKEWMPSVGNLWRSGGDIHDNWDSMMGQIGPNEELAPYAGPGHWERPGHAGSGQWRHDGHRISRPFQHVGRHGGTPHRRQ